jgi:hypothetical protein
MQAVRVYAHAEHWVGTVRRECTDRLLITSDSQLTAVCPSTPVTTTNIVDTGPCPATTDPAPASH